MAGKGGERCTQSSETGVQDEESFELEGVTGFNQAQRGKYSHSDPADCLYIFARCLPSIYTEY